MSKKASTALATATAADVFLLQPTESLEEILSSIMESCKRFDERTHQQKYDKLAMGLYLLKAQVIHRLAPANRGQGRKSSPPADLIVSDDAKGGFHEWIFSHIPGLVPARAHELINLALNLKLTPGDGIEDVEALRASDALKDVTLKTLYRTPDALMPPKRKGSGAPEDKSEAAQQLFLPFFDQVFSFTENFEAQLFELPLLSQDPQKPSLEELERRLAALLTKVRSVKTQKHAHHRKGRK